MKVAVTPVKKINSFFQSYEFVFNIIFANNMWNGKTNKSNFSLFGRYNYDYIFIHLLLFQIDKHIPRRYYVNIHTQVIVSELVIKLLDYQVFKVGTAEKKVPNLNLPFCHQNKDIIINEFSHFSKF